jgi:hypothetical protein
MSDTDETAPWWEFINYVRSCESLGVTPSLQRFQRFMAYQRYLKTIGVIK